MRTRRNGAALLFAAVAALTTVLTLAGCVQPAPRVIPTAEPSSTPVFASNAEALAAAKKAYVGYLAASDAVAHDGGNGLDRLKSWESGSQFERDSKSLSTMKSEGHHTTGVSSFSHFSLEKSAVVDEKAAVVAYVCLEIGGTQLLDSAGANVGADRPLSLPLEVSFVSGSARAKTLIVDRSVGWPGTDFCS